MADAFNPLITCNEPLPAATVVDRIPFYRFITLEMRGDNGTIRSAVYPPDYAVPELVRELAVGGWPPDDLAAARGGLPLIRDWQETPEQCRTLPAVRFEGEDLYDFLANP